MNDVEVIKSSDIREGQYGNATHAIKQVLALTESMKWFPAKNPDLQANPEDLLDAHLRLVLPTAQPLRVEFRDGELPLAANLYRRINSIAEVDIQPSGVWRRALTALAAKTHAVLERPERRSVIEPPLFAFSGRSGVLSGMLAASREKLIARSPSLDNRDRETIWWLMCDVDKDFWETILWQLAYAAELNKNPFYLLAQIYTCGFYPLGMLDDEFVIYSFAEG